MEKLLKERFLTINKRFVVGDNNYQTFSRQIDKLYSYMTEKKSYENEVDILNDVTCDVTEDFTLYLEDKRYKKSTINNIMSCNKEFFKYLTTKRHLFQFNPFDTFEGFSQSEVEQEKTKKESLTVEEMKKILSNVENSIATNKKNVQDFLIARDRFLLALMFCNGARISETLSIKLDYIKKINGVYTIQVPASIVKNKMDKALVIPKSIEKYFKDYMFERSCLSKKFDSDLLFISINGKEINRRNACDIFNRVIKASNITKKISPHSMRYSCLLQLQTNEVDLQLSKKILGWKDSDISGHYSKPANDPIYNELKMKACDLLV